MANNPKKVKDPTEVALSAIQEALNISDTTSDNSRSAARNDVAPPMPPENSAYNEPVYEARPERRHAGVRTDRGAAHVLAPSRQ